MSMNKERGMRRKNPYEEIQVRKECKLIAMMNNSRMS
jgi:hypothetical protein